MELSTKIYREKTEEFLKGVPEGKRIHIDKDILEKMLFQEIVWDEEKNTRFKLPVWSGEFLSKIDLSEISFEDVSWALLDKSDIHTTKELIERYFNNEDELEKVLKQFPKTTDESYKNKPSICYKNTNTKIDFSKSFEAKVLGEKFVLRCDFSGIDLSENDLTNYEFGACDLTDTKILLLPEMYTVDKYDEYFWGTNLTNVDLSRFTVNASDLFAEEDEERIFSPSCNFTNTGLKILYDSTADEYIKEELGEAMPRLIGCYINGKKVLSKEELKELKETKLKEYEAYEEEMVDSYFEKLKKDNNISL